MKIQTLYLLLIGAMIFSCGDDDDDDSDPLEGVEYEMLISSRSNNSVVSSPVSPLNLTTLLNAHQQPIK